MTLLMCEGFEGVTAADYANRIFSSNSWSRPDATEYTGRFGVGKSWGRNGGSSLVLRYYFNGTEYGYVPDEVAYILGFAVKRRNGSNEINITTWGVQGSYNDAWGMEIGDSYVRVKAHNVLSPEYDYAVPQGSWCYVELKYRGHASAGVYELRVNGSVLYTFSGDTHYSTAGDNLGFIFADEAWSGWEIDDLYFLAVDGVGLNDFLGDSRVDTVLATGAGNSTQLTPSAGANYECINEDPNDPADYVEGDTDGLKDTFVYADVPTDIDDNNIYAVCVDNHARRTQPVGGVILRNVLRSNGTDYYGPQDYAVGDSTVGWKKSVWEKDPDDNGDWTQVKINACEFGAELSIP